MTRSSMWKALHAATSERLEAPCWCGARFGFVPASDVVSGRTFSCGRAGCGPVEEGA